MSFTDDELNLALLRFGSDNEAVALDGFRVLTEFGFPYLRTHFRSTSKRTSLEDVDEVVIVTLETLWRKRDKYCHESVPAFKKYLQRLARNSRADFAKNNPNHAPLDDTGEGIPFWEDGPDKKRLMDAVLLAAGEVWLGYDPKLSLAERDQRVLAAQIVYLDGGDWEEAMAIAGGPPDREVFRQWVCDPAVVRDLAYRRLDLSGYDLVRHLLGVEGDLLDVYQKAVRNKAQWETAAIFWKYRDADLSPTIKAQTKTLRGAAYEEAQLNELFARCDANLPFLPITEMLCERFSHDFENLFEGNGLWKRLVFDLWHLRRVPQADIETRLLGPSLHAGAKHPVNESLLTSWIGNRVLLKDLRARLIEMGVVR